MGTRERIAESARALFAVRGFERVTVAEVAAAAEVPERTVFDHFPTKEDLVFWRLESFEDQLLATIRERPAGESALGAFGRFVLDRPGNLGSTDPEALSRLRDLNRMIAESPALLGREGAIFDRFSDSLGRLLAEETGAGPTDLTPRVAASAMVGVHRALVEHARGQIIAGVPPEEIASDVRAQVEAALLSLAGGLGDYDVR